MSLHLIYHRINFSIFETKKARCIVIYDIVLLLAKAKSWYPGRHFMRLSLEQVHINDGRLSLNWEFIMEISIQAH